LARSTPSRFGAPGLAQIYRRVQITERFPQMAEHIADREDVPSSALPFARFQPGRDGPPTPRLVLFDSFFIFRAFCLGVGRRFHGIDCFFIVRAIQKVGSRGKRFSFLSATERWERVLTFAICGLVPISLCSMTCGDRVLCNVCPWIRIIHVFKLMLRRAA
jgi:hypothetical protein